MSESSFEVSGKFSYNVDNSFIHVGKINLEGRAN